MPPVDLRTSWYFPTPVRLAGAILASFGMLIVFVNIYIGLVLIMGGAVAITTHYRIAVDFTNKLYRDYVWVLGIKSGEKSKFDSIQYVFINKSRVSQTMYSRVNSSTIIRDEYNGYLKFTESDKVHLASNENKESLATRMRAIAVSLNCDLVDYTTGVKTRM